MALMSPATGTFRAIGGGRDDHRDAEFPRDGDQFLDDLAGLPRLTFDQGTNNSFYFAEEILSTLSSSREIRVSEHSFWTVGNTMREALLHALAYATRDRKQRKRQMRELWIHRVNAAARMNGLSYSVFIAGLKRNDVAIDRKMLADLAVRDAAAFTAVADVAKRA